VTHFLYKLLGPRPTFGPGDMTPEEHAIMGEHSTYWHGLLDQGRVIVFGPVLEPSGAWGLAVVEAADEDEVRRLGDGDPAVTSGVATFEVHPMPLTSVRT
jgi:uncharacterized protein